ncbi:MAG TPA: alpha-amylase family protein [Actinophytocola sp.]|uniref:alpha-amylase family protein n=1 Tax=Actinophytocola sp. TaxID=1872138 RepID=UPI002DDD728A|nr:alpha-amylase family protein [Actinophytocola sp.]HEV2778463.1 alpha-amylase family protein [Actinophytocola sp.]
MERWYRNTVIYSLDVSMFQDANGDGIGDLPGLISRLDYLSRLGVGTIWLNPIYPSPRLDGGYDITDYYTIDPRFGSLGDFSELLNQADELGLRIMLDLVVNHTSDQHPWFQSARADPDSPYRDWYVWSETEPPDRWLGTAFPGVEKETWTHDPVADAWYRHRFYRWQPDLNTDNPEVRAEIYKIIGYWLRLGVAGFRIDAAPFLVESRRPDEPTTWPDYGLLRQIRETVSWRRADAVLLAEANVGDEELLEYFGEGDGEPTRMMMLFAFRLNQAIMLALAREDAGPVRAVLDRLPDLPRHAQWATFLRNHDEVDLGRLSDDEREDVFAAFGPEPDMRLYDRGIRRRLAPMLAGDRRRLEMAYSLQLTMPGTPVLRYGDEIGMGEDLSRPEREAIRTPMQWSHTDNAGFSRAEPEQLIAPPIGAGPYGYPKINVTEQRLDPNSLLTWFERILHTRRECEEIGTGEHQVLDSGQPHVLVHTATGQRGRTLFLHNLSPDPCHCSLDPRLAGDSTPLGLAADADYGTGVDLTAIDLNGYGYRWIRLHRSF